MRNSKNKNKILICGGTGFIGQRLVKELLKQGRNINLFAYGKIPPTLKNKNLNVFKGSILDKEVLKRALKESDIVVNLVGSFEKDIYSTNVLGSSNLLEICKKSKIKKIIFISSEAIYGKYPGRPSVESDRPEPVTEYGLSKYLAEKIYKFYSDQYNIPTIILRPPNTYGPGQKKGVVFDFLSPILRSESVTVHNDGKQERGFLYIDDLVNGIIKSIDYKLTGFEIFNISARKRYSLLGLISTIKQNIKKEIKVKFVEYKEPDIKCMFSDYQKAKSLLKYEPKVSLEKGIAKTIASYKRTL